MSKRLKSEKGQFLNHCSSACDICTATCKRKFEAGDAVHQPAFCSFFQLDKKSSLSIPPRFAAEVRDKLNENIVLEGPSGHIWPVKYQQMKFTEGWKEFVTDNHLKPGMLLYFSMMYPSYFEVKIFNANGNEKESDFRIIEL
eukprot:TRINITY_DN13783_c0_g2_i1.p1 TRINITY_DN13783_c0_g2~~TRINITY_DN13783_c0_g2_i1.p1  ORF type:complete len:142 (+),score=23.55 TRINITY_DN13783_c0_g2_i1:156-581(+)